MLEKLTLRYEPAEDRLLLVLHLRQDQHRQLSRVHITRRLAAGWKADLTAMLALAESEPASAYTRQAPVHAPSSAAREARGLSGQDAPAQPAASVTADGDQTPALATRVRCARRRTDGRWLVRFDVADRPPASLLLSDQALKDLADVLRRQLEKANWALGPTDRRGIAANPTKPRALH